MSSEAVPIWQEPVRGAFTNPELFATLSGYELLRTYIDGRQLPPPLRNLYGLLITDVQPESVTFTMPASPWLSPPHGVLQGAAMALLVDGPLGCTVQTALPPATPYTTSEMSLSFIHPVLPDGGTLTSKGRLIHAGRTIGLSEAPVVDAAGNLVALSSCRCVILPTVDLPKVSIDDIPPPVEPHWPTPDPRDRPVQGRIYEQEIFDRMGGLEFFRGILSGDIEFPPIHHLMGLRLLQAEDGANTWALPASEWLCSPVQGRLYGGAIAYLAGNAADCAIMTTCEAGTAIAPVDLKVYFLRPVTPDGREMVATSKVVHRGRQVAIATSEVRDADGKLVATAISSSMILPGRPATIVRPLAPEDLALEDAAGN